LVISLANVKHNGQWACKCSKYYIDGYQLWESKGRGNYYKLTIHTPLFRRFEEYMREEHGVRI